ncbi:hypothetical protein C1879_01480 [Paraeggerthella hongkongensis]|nr:hypothetical protein C1879_01480 [Paraeggerthella hongkongensis]
METLNTMWQKSIRVLLALALAATMTPFVAPEKAHAEGEDVVSAAQEVVPFEDAATPVADPVATAADVSIPAPAATTGEAQGDGSPENPYKINGFSDLLYYTALSRVPGRQYINIVLEKDIDLTEEDIAQITNGQGFVFGTIDLPYSGTFDGNGKTIAGLNYERDEMMPKANTGLFASTDGATIKNLTLKDAYIGSDFRGGVLVSLAQNTRIENVTLVNCTASVTPANNVVSLITNAGVIGGVLAGTVRNCTLYNCEVQGGYAVQNSTAGVAALGGQYLYMGGLVGAADNSTIEYCRVTPYRSTDAEGKPVVQHTGVKNKYDNAVGALGGFTVYAGGLAGIAQSGTKIIDCFSTADTYAYCGTYVSVGAGATAHVGGLAAYASDTSVERSHYAGNLHSYQYNALLVIPIIEVDVNLAGIVESTGNDVKVSDSYFKRSASATTKKIDAVDDNASGASYGPLDDGKYSERDFWEGAGYDFAGGIARSSAYSDSHINKWVMDYNLGIPVHGSSIKATFDFPGAGSVEIGPTKLSPNSPQGTDNPWKFVVQGVLADDKEVGISTTPTLEPDTDTGANLGYAFRSWHRIPDVTVNEITEDPEYFKLTDANMIAGEGEPAHQLSNENPEDIKFENDDLFVAHYQANVVFHDVNGGVIDKETGETESAPDATDDWYSYYDPLPDVVPITKPSSGSATFIGWTTTPEASTDANKTPGYEAITSTFLDELKKSGDFYLAGDPAEKPMDLYPVYSDYISNVKVIFEGHEQDTEDMENMREGVGSVAVTKNADNGTYQIKMTGVGESGTLPDGYRFLGWYEDGHRVSSEETFSLDGVDLTQEHTYTARFEYRVDYWVLAAKNGSSSEEAIYKESTLYASWWHSYKEEFNSISAPVFLFATWSHWGLSGHEDPVAFSGPITNKTKVHSCYDSTTTTYYIEMFSDFPDSVNLTYSTNSVVGNLKITAAENTGFSFIGYTFEKNLAGIGGDETYREDKVFDKSITATGYDYTYVARLTAKINFHDKTEALLNTITRRYEEKVLLDTDAPHTYKYVTQDKESGLKTVSEKSPSAPVYDGYRFLGWVDKDVLTAEEKTWLYDVGEENCTSSASKATPYLLSADAVCTRPMDLYPVYVKYDVSTTTNIKRAGVPAGVNVPTAPTIDNGTNGTLTLPYLAYGIPAKPAQNISVDANGNIDSLSLTIDANTKVVDEREELYKLTSITVEKDGVPVATIPAVEGQTQYTYNDVISPGPSYTFVANYEPLVAVYHLSDSEVETVVRNNGDPLGKGPDPKFDIDKIDADLSTTEKKVVHVFVGWTAAKPESRNYVIWSGTTSMVSPKTIVRQSMELWPVYRASTVSVNSNIDEIIKDPANPANPEDYRSLKRLGAIDSVTLVAEAKDFPGYEFDHWATNYADGNGGTRITDANNFVLRGDLPFAGTVYTAVYVPVHEVRYHNTSGEVIYTANVVGDKRKFVTLVDKDPGSGETSGEKVEVPIDTEAYQIIAEKLNESAGVEGCTTRETFSNWQWAKSDGNVVPWDDFKNNEITQDMDLYPITWRVSAADEKGTAITNQLTWAIDVNALEAKEPGQGGGTTEPDPAAQVERVKQDYPIQAYFGQGNYYDQAFLTVHVEKVSYPLLSDNKSVDATAAIGKKVALYDDTITGNVVQSHSGDPAAFKDFQTVKYKGDMVFKKTNGEIRSALADGDALFVLGDVQPLTVTKRTMSPHAAGEVFLFTVTSVDTNGSKTVVPVSVQCSTTPDSEGYYTGSVQLKLKPGTYYVKENASWAWRCDQKYLANGTPVALGSDGAKVVVSRSQDGSSIVCENLELSDAWLDGSARKINEFGSGAATNG